jgi:hypothetical protein
MSKVSKVDKAGIIFARGDCVGACNIGEVESDTCVIVVQCGVTRRAAPGGFG